MARNRMFNFAFLQRPSIGFSDRLTPDYLFVKLSDLLLEFDQRTLHRNGGNHAQGPDRR